MFDALGLDGCPGLVDAGLDLEGEGGQWDCGGNWDRAYGRAIEGGRRGEGLTA